MQLWSSRSARLSRSADAQTRYEQRCDSQCIEEPAEVARIAGEQSVFAVGEERHMGVDDVTCPRDAQQFADTSGGGLIQGSDLGAPEQASQIRLPRHAAPHLSNDPTAGDRGCATHL